MTLYTDFVKLQMARLDKSVLFKDRMAMIAKLWKDSKEDIPAKAKKEPKCNGYGRFTGNNGVDLFIYIFYVFIYIMVGSWIQAVSDCCQLYVVVIRRSNSCFVNKEIWRFGLVNQIYIGE